MAVRLTAHSRAIAMAVAVPVRATLYNYTQGPAVAARVRIYSHTTALAVAVRVCSRTLGLAMAVRVKEDNHITALARGKRASKQITLRNIPP